MRRTREAGAVDIQGRRRSYTNQEIASGVGNEYFL